MSEFTQSNECVEEHKTEPSIVSSVLTNIEQENVSLVRQILQDVIDPDSHISNDCDVLRFLRARNGDVNKAADMLRAHLLWRAKEKPWKMYCQTCEDEPGYHALRQCGFDSDGHALLYTCFDQCADGIGFKNGTEHMIHGIENAILSMKHHNTVVKGCEGDGKWIWVLDFQGFGFKNMQIGPARETISIFSNQYPERLHKIIMLNAPWILGGFISLLKPFVDAVTFSKVCFIRGDSNIMREKLIVLLGNEKESFEVVDWLVKEVELNQQSPFPATQTQWWKTPEPVTTPILQDGKSVMRVHDPRGTPSWIRDVLEARVLLRHHEPSKCCQWPGNAFPAPMLVRELTGGMTLLDHFELIEKEKL